MLYQIPLLGELNLVSVTVRLLLSLVLGGAIGFERGRRGRAAGFRTHILVCIGACMASVAGIFVTEVLGYGSDPTRIAAQVISGIGFLGVGTILVTGSLQVRGLTTAAGLWSTAAVGICVGFGFYEAAVICSLLLVFVLVLLHRLDNIFFGNSADIDVYFEIDDIRCVSRVIKDVNEKGYKIHSIEIKPPKSQTDGAVGVEATIDAVRKFKKTDIISEVASVQGIIFIIQRD